MAVSAGTFSKLATKLVTGTFGAFQKTLVMRTPVLPIAVGSDPTYTDETGTAIKMALDLKLFEGQKVGIDDFMLVTNAAQWTTDPETSNTEFTFDGKALAGISIKKDADNAAYFIKAHKK